MCRGHLILSVVHFSRFSVLQTIWHWMIGWLRNNELEKIWKEKIMAYSIWYLGICLGLLWKTTKISVRTGSIPAEVQTKHLPHTSLEGIRHTTLIGLITCLSEHDIYHSMLVLACAPRTKEEHHLNYVHLFALIYVCTITLSGATLSVYVH
jgi:hypothetical protein